MKNSNRNKIEEISALLVDNKILNFPDMVQLYRNFRKRDDIEFEDFLLEEGIVSKEELLGVLSLYYKIQSFDTIGAFFDHQFLSLIPKQVMLEYEFIPYKRDIDSDILTVVAAKPDRPGLLVILGQYISHEINFMVGLAQDIRDSIEEFYDESITYQPYTISNQLMERSMIEIYPLGEQFYQIKDHTEIPLVWEDTVDDAERY